MKKLFKLIMGMGVVLVGVGGFLWFINSDNAKSSEFLSIYDDLNPIPFEDENGLKGYMDGQGNIIIKPIYQDADHFVRNYALVTLNNDQYVIDMLGYKVLDVDDYETIFLKYYEDNGGAWLINGILYDNKLNRISDKSLEVKHYSDNFFVGYDIKTDEYCFMNNKGKIVHTSKNDDSFDTFKNEATNKSYGIIKTDEYYKVVSHETGKIIYETNSITNKDIYGYDYDFVISEKNTEKKYTYTRYYIGSNDEIIFKGDAFFRKYNDDYIEIEIIDEPQNKFKYIKIDDNTIHETIDAKKETREEVDEHHDVDYKVYKCETNEKSYTIVYNGEVKQECGDVPTCIGDELYNYIKDTHNKNLIYILDLDNSKLRIYDFKNNIDVHTIDILKYDDWFNIVFDSSDTPFLNYTTKNNEFIIYNIITNKSKPFNKSASIYYGTNYIKVVDGNMMYYYNNNLEVIYSRKTK